MYKLVKDTSIINCKVDGVRRKYDKDNVHLLPESEFKRLEKYKIVKLIKVKDGTKSKSETSRDKKGGES